MKALLSFLLVSFFLFFSSIMVVASNHHGYKNHKYSVHKKNKKHGYRKHTKHKKHHRKSILNGTKNSQLVQNREADKEGLSRIKSSKQLRRMIRKHQLVKITSRVSIDPRLSEIFCYVRPWVNDYLNPMADAFEKKFGCETKLQINSGVRTIEHQKKLQKTNGNAAAAHGPRASSHLTGATVDMAKNNLSPQQRRWVIQYLYSSKCNRKIDAVEEFHQAVFHFMVFKPKVQHNNHLKHHKHKRHHVGKHK